MRLCGIGSEPQFDQPPAAQGAQSLSGPPVQGTEFLRGVLPPRPRQGGWQGRHSLTPKR